jgi:hypothetical protein
MTVFTITLTSMNMIDGFPISEIAVDNFRLFPPEYCPTDRSAQSVRPSRFNKQSAIYKILGSIFPNRHKSKFTNEIFFCLIPRNRA